MKTTFNFSSPPQQVFALLTDPDFLVNRSLAIGELEAECEVEESDDETTVKMSRKVHRELPGFMAKLFNSTQVLKFHEQWSMRDDGFNGKYKITIPGTPVIIDAGFSLLENSKGSVYSIQHKAVVKVPLIAGKIEKYVLQNIKQDIQKEMDYLTEKLAE